MRNFRSGTLSGDDCDSLGKLKKRTHFRLMPSGSPGETNPIPGDDSLDARETSCWPVIKNVNTNQVPGFNRT